mmetsp:Transcript_53296/g.79177  ORF Transcript_53296/g.79177 Transcript_53296/m.79177 type:complete len:467 (+) Transcript_53296:56-1456(+)
MMNQHGHRQNAMVSVGLHACDTGENEADDRNAKKEQDKTISFASPLDHMFDSPDQSIASGLSSVATGVMAHWKVFFFGQILAFVMALRGASSDLFLIQCGLFAPAFQNGVMYVVLSFHFLYFMMKQRQKLKVKCGKSEGGGETNNLNSTKTNDSGSSNKKDDDMALGDAESDSKRISPRLQYKIPVTNIRLSLPWWYYFVVSFIDLEANYFTFLALQFTSLKNVALLGALAIPTAMISSWFLLGRKYTFTHLFGAFICICGSALVLIADYGEEQGGGYVHDAGVVQDSSGEQVYNNGQKYPFAGTGDIIAALGGILSGIADPLAEKSLKYAGSTEYLGMLGLYGSIISAAQVLMFEMDAVRVFFSGATCPPGHVFLSLMAILISFYVFYIGQSRFLIVSEAAMFNLSMLSADLWSLLFSLVEEHSIPTKVFFVSIMFITVGMLVYGKAPSPIVDGDAFSKVLELSE